MHGSVAGAAPLGREGAGPQETGAALGAAPAAVGEAPRQEPPSQGRGEPTSEETARAAEESEQGEEGGEGGERHGRE